jgi:hypothetical protein
MAEGEDIDLVEDIIMTPFSRQTFQEKLDIVRRGRRRRYKACHRRERGSFTTFNYGRYQWLTGSEKHCKLYCWEPHWLCKPELSNQGSNETPKYSCALTSNGAFENFWGHPSGSTAPWTSAQGNEAAQWKGIVLFPCNSLNKNVNFKVKQRLVILRFCLNV